MKSVNVFEKESYGMAKLNLSLELKDDLTFL